MDKWHANNLFSFLLIGICGVFTYAHVQSQDLSAARNANLEEIVLDFEAQRLFKVDILAQYDGDTIYLPLVKVLRQLDMNVIVDFENAKFSGSLSARDERFEINILKSRAKTPFADYKLQTRDYYYDGADLYLRVDLFKSLFKLPLLFDFANLRVFLRLNKEFPIYQKLKRAAQHEKLRLRKKEIGRVKSLPYRRQKFGGGALDWTASTNPVGGGGQFAQLNAGAVILGGDFNITGSGNTRTGIDPNQLRYRWRYFVGDNDYLTHTQLGDIFTSGTLGRSMRGALVTNKPVVQRRYFQTINLTGAPGEGWEVELYINNRLIDFQHTDQAGTYEFNLDVFYGGSVVRLQMYGPNGELRTEERFLQTPFNLVPKGELEYSASAGKTPVFAEDKYYFNSSVFYGVNSRLTAGVSADVPFSPIEGEVPLLSTELAFQAASNLTLSGSLSPDNAHRIGINFTQPSFISFSGEYTSFQENPIRNRISQKNRVSFSVSAPLRIKGKSVGLRLNALRNNFQTFSTTSLNYGASASLSRAHLNYLGRYRITDVGSRSTKSVISLLIATINVSRLLRPQLRAEYDHSESQIVTYSVNLSKRLFRKGQMTFTFERNELVKVNSFLLTFNLITDVAHLTSRSRVIQNQVSLSQVYRGSMQYDHEAKNIRFDKNSSVGYGAAVIRPFYDLNYNGSYDHGEETVSGLRAKFRGSGGERRKSDRLYFYERLQAYDNYLVEIDERSLDDPTLRPSEENFMVRLNPNMVTTIDVPLVTASDISGSISRLTTAGRRGVGGVKIIVLNLSRDIITEITSFNDGEFYYLGLLPGKYRAYLEQDELEEYGYQAEPPSIEFEIKPELGGSSIEGINFLLTQK